MTETVVSSSRREIAIGFDRPFVIIGERINPTGRKVLAAEMAADDFSRVEADALAQVQAGAQMLDVNAGIPLADEPALLARAVRLVQSVTDVPLSIDSSIVAALEAGLAVYGAAVDVGSTTIAAHVCDLTSGEVVSSVGAMNPQIRIVEDERTFAYVLHRGDIEVRVTQNDVRAIQLAKAALYAGVRLLMDRLDVDRVDRIRLAGAFGSHIDVKYAMVLGLVPDCALEHVTSAGNAAPARVRESRCWTAARWRLIGHRRRVRPRGEPCAALRRWTSSRAWNVRHGNGPPVLAAPLWDSDPYNVAN